jgi:hypothetical protein
MGTATIQADKRIERMVELCRAHGMPEGQVRGFAVAGYILLEQMMDFHAAARDADRPGGPDEIGLGGTRGPGKSYAIMQQVGNDDCQRVAGLKWLFLRKIMKSAAESLDDLTRKVFQYTPHEFTKSGVEFVNGSRILIGGYKDPADIDKYLGLEYDGIAIEEATQLTDDKKQKIRGSMRSSKANWRTRMYLSSNADGIGLAWFKKTFVIPARNHCEINTRFFDVSYKGNPFLDESYVQWLERLQGPLGKAWREADWDAFSGMAFPAWDYDRHVIPLAEVFEVPTHWVKWTATDWGYASPFSTHWYAKDPDTRRILVYREAYGANLTDRQQARMIVDMSPPTENITLHYADPSLWERKNREGEVFSTADEYRREGMILTKADNDRLSGIRKVHNLMADLPDGKPGLQIFESCSHLIEQLSTLALDENRPEDVDTDQEDHAYDDLRYALTNERKLIKLPDGPNRTRNPSYRYRNIT